MLASSRSSERSLMVENAGNASPERGGVWLNRQRALAFLVEHDLFRKPAFGIVL
jgi:hypothetical protein